MWLVVDLLLVGNGLVMIGWLGGLVALVLGLVALVLGLVILEFEDLEIDSIFFNFVYFGNNYVSNINECLLLDADRYSLISMVNL